MTEKFVLKENVLQGDVFGNILASNEIHKFGKYCLENMQHIYTYRNTIPIAPLTMCDHILTISECGFQTKFMT